MAAIESIQECRCAAVTPVRLTARGWSFRVASEPEDGKIEIDDLFQATQAAAEARRFEVVEALKRRGVEVLHCDDVREAVGYVIGGYVRDVYRLMLDRADCAIAH